jgi:signal peptidase I
MGALAVTPFELLGLVGVFIVARVVLTLQPVRTNSQGKSTTFAREYLDPFIYAGIAAFLLITFVARTYYIPSGSMIPTLQVGDVLLVN